MSILGDAFPDDYRKQYIERNLTVGTVLRLYVTDTTPPKHKFFIVIGFSGDKLALGVVYINTEINPYLFPTEELKRLHIPFKADERGLVDHDCYINCSKIFEKEVSYIETQIEAQTDSVRGQLSEDELKKVQITIYSARTIAPNVKRRFGY